ncbi:molecular chaperone [Microthyrium microscopicum]|uniref:Molecular chaperone n=1 Tax=Microthyrium microscopicum TaxID=703497 RepID=A0A6A6UHR8_9PEZI|nr:molecular chaperone [Microthyrium microscopicum]
MLAPLSWQLLFLVFAVLALCAEDYYKLLEIKKDATDRELKKAYRMLSKKYHPDKNQGDQTAHDKFVAIAEAYDILSDEETRRIYDQYGHDGVKQHKAGGGPGRGHDPFDLFSRFFGGSGHFGHGQREQRGPDKTATIQLPLRDFYNGVERDFSIEKQVVCSACEGSGSEDGQRDQCTTCQGHGVVIQKHQIAPGFIQQMQMQCPKCKGKGHTVRHVCPVCQGNRVTREKEEYKLVVERGLPRGMRITYENEADESPDWQAGDLVLEVHEAPPEIATKGESDKTKTADGTFFRRKGRDLFWREVLSLREAWMGDWTRNITHLDGHIVSLKRERGHVVQPGQVEVLDGEGMPVWYEDKATDEFGRLFVEYFVVLPDQMEGGMEKDFWALWEKWRLKQGVHLDKEAGRVKDEL